MNKSTGLALVGATLVLFSVRVAAQSSTVVQAAPMTNGTISPMLFGNFIELVDDVTPAMWAEMLNDRCFEGVLPLFSSVYYNGASNICDRDWDTNATWSFDTTEVFSSARAGKLASSGTNIAYITQSGLAVQPGMQYNFSGYFWGTGAGAAMSVQLLSPLSTNQSQWPVLASATLPSLTTNGAWQKLTAQMVSSGQTDQGVFKLQIQGGGPVWMDKLSLMPGNNMLGWRADVIAAMSNAHPALIRWGGSEVDPGGYVWSNGIGSHALRLPFTNAAWGRIDPNDVGIDEFCQFCGLVGAAPLVCVGFDNGAGAQSAGNLVQYCNGATNTVWGGLRATNGHPAPYAVPYFEIGNEINTGESAYLSAFPTFVQDMKASDPTIQIMSSTPTQAILTAQGTNMNFIDPHYYTGDITSVDSSLTSLTTMINTTPGCSNVMICTGEWNVTAGSFGLGRAQLQTLSSALLNANYLNVMMRHSDKVTMACRSDMANALCTGLIETSVTGLGVINRPSYCVLQLYANHAGAKTNAIPLTVSQPGNGLDVFACATSNYQSVAIFVVNANTASVPFTFSFTGFSGSMSAVSAQTVCDTKNLGQTDIGNHWPSPNRVQTVPLTVSPNSVTLPALSATAIECN